MKLKDKVKEQRTWEDTYIEIAKEDEDQEFDVDIEQVKKLSIDKYADGRSIDECFFPWNFPCDRS